MYCRPTKKSNAEGHRRYPYLLRDLEIVEPNQVWSADITYIPMPMEFMYLAAIMDWYSRYVIGWRLSNSLEGSFCVALLEDALKQSRPVIFNTDQGVQFTARAWTNQLEESSVQVSMDGRGRCHDNIFIERLWRSVKYEDVYLYGYGSVVELEAGLKEYFRFYNEDRPHQALENRTPKEAYEKG